MVFFRSPVTKSHTLITLSAPALANVRPSRFQLTPEHMMGMAFKGLHNFAAGQVQNFHKLICRAGGQVFAIG